MRQNFIVLRTWIAHCTNDGGPQDCHGNPRHDDWTSACGHYEYVVISTIDDEGGGGTPVGIGTPTGGEGGGPGGSNYSNGSSNNGTNQDGEIPLTNNTPPIKNTIIPSDQVVEEIVKDPCEKIKKQFTDFPTLKSSLVQLATTVTQSNENGIFIDNVATPTSPNPIENIPSNSSLGGTINLNMNPVNKYIMIAHTHDAYGSNGSGTYSIFSWDDLTTINNLIRNNHINVQEFVFYVINADGTRYAITIDSASNMNNFFYDPSNLGIGATVDVERLLKMNEKFDKYYNKNKNGLITTTSNKDDDKIAFLKFIKEAKLGINLFQIDETFTNFEKLSLNSHGAVIPSPCN